MMKVNRYCLFLCITYKKSKSSSFLPYLQAEDDLGELQQEMETQKNLLRQQALDEKRVLDEKFKELKMDYDEMKGRVEELDVKVHINQYQSVSN